MKRMPPKARKTQLLEAAVNAADKYGYHNFTRDHIAEFSGASATLITNYFNTVNQLKRAVMRSAIHTERLKIIAEGIVTGDEQAKKANIELKNKAINSIGA